MTMPFKKDPEGGDDALQQQVFRLRRSKRKRSIARTESSVYKTSAKEIKRSRTALQSTIPTPSLSTLPYVVVKKLLLYMDVNTLESLSGTCSYFDGLISGRFLTSIDFPLPQDFISEVATTNRLEKKPLLKLRCKKTEDNLWTIFPDLETTSTTTDYMLQFQLSLLSLGKIRELDFVPGGLSRMEGGVKMVNKTTKWKYEEFDLRLFDCINSMGSLQHVTRLSILFNDTWISESYRFLLPSLKELGLTILEDQGTR